MIQRHRAGDLVDGALGGAVGHDARRADAAPDRAEVDDDAVALRFHRADGGAAHEKHPVDVDVHHPLPLLVAGAQRVSAHDDAGRVDQHIQPAMALQRSFHGLAAKGGVADIAHYRRPGVDLAGYLSCQLLVAVDDHHLSAGRAELARRGRAHSRGCPGDQGCFSSEVHRTVLTPWCVSACRGRPQRQLN